MSFEELKAIPGMASNRAATLPDAAALLAALVNIIDVPDMTVSSSGLREGLLYQALDERTRAQDPLIVAAEFEGRRLARFARSEEHTSELQSLMRISYAVFCLKKKNPTPKKNEHSNATQNRH